MKGKTDKWKGIQGVVKGLAFRYSIHQSFLATLSLVPKTLFIIYTHSQLSCFTMLKEQA